MARPLGKSKSQSPDGDFFDPEANGTVTANFAMTGHSPLTGIFLIRREDYGFFNEIEFGHSPLTGIFLIRSAATSVR